MHDTGSCQAVSVMRNPVAHVGDEGIKGSRKRVDNSGPVITCILSRCPASKCLLPWLHNARHAYEHMYVSTVYLGPPLSLRQCPHQGLA